MKKDNFDLRSYLVENKMTENSRGDVRHQLGETVLDTRILSEMQIPIEEAGSSYPKAQEWLSQHPNVEIIRDITSVVDPEEDPDYVTSATEAGYAFISELEAMLNSGECDDDFIASACENGVIDDPEFNPPASEFNYGSNPIDECGDLGGDISLDEASYTDDDDDEWTDPDAIGDDDNGASLLDLVRGDKKAASARKAAAKDSADDFDPTAGEPESFGDEPAVDPEDAEPSAGESDPNAEAQPGLSAQIKYNPNTVEMMMDDQELDQYLSGFRRPQVAVNVLNRAIRTAQDEVNDSIGLNHLYIVLENGFYVTSRTERGQVIAKVNADQAWREKNFGEGLEEGIFGKKKNDDNKDKVKPSRKGTKDPILGRRRVADPDPDGIYL